MPKVGKRHFAYTRKGEAFAKLTARRAGKPVVYKKKSRKSRKSRRSVA